MAQSWKVFAPEKKVCFEWQEYGLTLGDFLFDGAADDLVIHLAVPAAEDVQDLQGRLSPAPRTFLLENSSQLVGLPTEILEEILSHLDIESLFCLSTCSTYLFYLCRKRIFSFLKSECATLAGTSLICVGNWLRPDDYPPGIDWRSKMEVIQKMYQEEPDENPSSSHSEDEQPQQGSATKMTLYDIAAELEFPVLETPERSPWISMSSTQISGFNHAFDQLPSRLRKDLSFLMRLDHYNFYSMDSEWVLRNLTTKEFVRRSVVGYGSNGPFSYKGSSFGLGEVLLSRICWSSDCCSSCIPSDGIHRGIWAGHKFDITLMDALKGEEGWKDVSESAFEQLKVIWESAYGENWEKVWRGEELD